MLIIKKYKCGDGIANIFLLMLNSISSSLLLYFTLSDISAIPGTSDMDIHIKVVLRAESALIPWHPKAS